MKKPVRIQESGLAYYYRIATHLCGDAFLDRACFEFYITRLLQRCRPHGIRLHAYCIMQKEILILATAVNCSATAALLGSLDSSYRDYFNLRFSRHLRRISGSIQRCALLDDASVLEAQKYVETQACRELNLQHPGAWHWSSYNANAFGGQTRGLVRHRALAVYLSQQQSSHGRYRQWLAEGFSTARLAWLDKQLNRGPFLTANLRRKNSRLA
ncbi:MAG: hypothetical protein MRY76_08365 [Pseudomonadales bacterium]|nr:hypothetical protein [Pseudomonadales bacterium]